MSKYRPNGIVIAFTLSLLTLNSDLLLGQYEGAEPPPENLQAGFDSITAEQCQDWLKILAGPAFEGRGTGQRGHVKAAHWVAGKVAEFGLQPMGEGDTYFQMLPMTRLIVDEEASKLSGPDDLTIGFPESVGLDRFTNQPEISGKLVFLAISGEAALPQELSLQDKIVILTTDQPALEGRAAVAMARKRPAAVLRVIDGQPTSTSQLQRPDSRQRGSSVIGTISRTAAQELVSAAAGQADWLDIPSELPIVTHETEVQVKIELRVREQPTAVPNVIAWQEGTDPEVNHEYVVMGAHLDHLGVSGSQIYPGADDNGSGSTALLNIAKAMATSPVKPRRSVLFIWFAAEEMGLQGSKHFVANPTLPLKDMVCMFNIDMVGRNEEKQGEEAIENVQTLHLVGSQKGDPLLHELILEANKCIKFDFEYDEEKVFGRSDHINFFRQGTSVAFLFGGFHPDYHRMSDSTEKINFPKIASAARLFYLSAYRAAEHGPFPVPEQAETPNAPPANAAETKN